MQNSKLQFKIQNKSGFTLIELMTVIAIVGILSTFVVANVLGTIKKARDGQRKADLRQIQSALEMYRADNGNYPTQLNNCPISGGSANTKLGDVSGSPACGRIYMDNIPKDPQAGLNYTYTPVAVGSNYLRYSVIACLENFNDPQKDSSNVSPCDGTNTWSYTLKNP